METVAADAHDAVPAGSRAWKLSRVMLMMLRFALCSRGHLALLTLMMQALPGFSAGSCCSDADEAC